MEAAKRGHEITIYEKSDSLGGLLSHTDYPTSNIPSVLLKIT
jgi:NADPH-dependent 2,4-dienoyl-CoA reductase/sulfur reductase-like enzyme